MATMSCTGRWCFNSHKSKEQLSNLSCRVLLLSYNAESCGEELAALTVSFC